MQPADADKRLKTAVIAVREHPFRRRPLEIAVQDKNLLPSYADALDEMANAYGKIAYGCTDSARYTLLMRTTPWLHTWFQTTDLLRRGLAAYAFEPFVDGTLDAVSGYLETGEMTEFWDIIKVNKDARFLPGIFPENWSKPHTTRYTVLEHFVRLGNTHIGAKSSKILPEFYPMRHTFLTDDDTVKDAISHYLFTPELAEHGARERAFKYWSENEKPVLEWVNAHVEPAGDREAYHDMWRCIDRSCFTVKTAMQKELSGKARRV